MNYRREIALLRLIWTLWEQLLEHTDTTEFEHQVRAAGLGWALPTWDHHHDDEWLTVDQVAFDTGHTPSAIRNWPARYGLRTIDGRYRWAVIRQLMETRGNRQAS